MSEQPYPAGTALTVTWPTSICGLEVVATERYRPIDSREARILGYPAGALTQWVRVTQWKPGAQRAEGYHPVRYMLPRPPEDADADTEPVGNDHEVSA